MRDSVTSRWDHYRSSDPDTWHAKQVSDDWRRIVWLIIATKFQTFANFTTRKFHRCSQERLAKAPLLALGKALRYNASQSGASVAHTRYTP